MKFEVESSFVHVYSGEKLYRTKVTYISGGMVYSVLNKEELKNRGVVV